jgi:hypothetical protein
VLEPVDYPKHLVVTIRDVTAEVLQQQKLAAIHKAGMELADLKPEEIFHMGVEERIELVKSNILHYTQDLLNFDVVEIRLLDPDTGELVPLLAVGSTPSPRNVASSLGRRTMASRALSPPPERVTSARIREKTHFTSRVSRGRAAR